MRHDDLFIAGLGVWLPPLQTVAEARQQGLISAERAAQLEFVSAAVAAPDQPGPWMAAQAGRAALKQAGIGPDDLTLVLHAVNWFQGVDMWPAAAYVAHEVGARHVGAFEVGQRCNGGLGAIELAAQALRSGLLDGDSVLVTTGDRMQLPRIDRWNIMRILIYGDAGTSAVLSRRGGFARVLSTCTGVDNSLELLARGDQEFAVEPPPSPAIDLDMRTRSVLESALPDARDRLSVMLHQVQHTVLEDAGLSMDEIAKVAVPHTRQGAERRELSDLLGVDDKDTTWEFGRTVGHIAAGDQIAGLEFLLRTGRVKPGDRVLLWGGGAGYSCTAAVVEILDVA